MSAIVEAGALRREFTVGRGRARRRLVAVEDVDLRIAPGEAVGFLGPNGAGKSTTIKMLTGILVPTAGRLRVCGLDPNRQRRALAHQIGVVFGQRSSCGGTSRCARASRCSGRSTGSGPPSTAPAWSAAPTCSSSARSSTRPSGSCHWASACAGR